MSHVITLDLPPEVSAAEARLLLAIQLFEDGRVSLGRAAEVAGLSRRTFSDGLGRRGIPVIDYPPTDLAGELSLDLGEDAAAT